jgi:hypothetical protein
LHRNYSYNDGEIEMDSEYINDFGKEDTSYIDPEKMTQISLNFDFKAYIYEKHFNQEHPENHNKELIKQKRKRVIAQHKLKNNVVPAIEDTLSKVC